jgi:ornithine cyclodeaminase/alanine dehydrogenase-like protein (mu-crystallin family)
MDIFAGEHDGAEVRYLPRAEVIRACAGVDPVAVVRRALEAHARGETTLPDEAYLGWQTGSGLAARCLAMPGGLHTDGHPILGLKVINGSLANTAQGIPRSQGFTMIFDAETARPKVIMEAAYISAIRTAAVTAVTALHLGAGITSLALIGCGTLAKAHLAVLPRALPDLVSVRLHDQDPARAEQLARAIRADIPQVTVTPDAQSCVDGADLVVPVTTVTAGYLPYAWLKPGAVLAHVSLDDALPDVVEQADLLLVDDWDLVRNDDRRLLGRMYREGRLLGPKDDQVPGVRKVDASLGEVLIGTHPGRQSKTDIILSNPFGMAILDVAMADEVYRVASGQDTGQWLPI